MSLDRDQQEFLGAYAKVKTLERDYFDFANKVFDDYHELNLFMNSVYDQAAELEKLYEQKKTH